MTQGTAWNGTAWSEHAPKQHDVVIVGGGLVGASLAIALDRQGLDVALIEATPGGRMPTVFDQRNLSFAAATVNALTALGVMQKLQSPVGLIRHIHVSRQGDFGRVKLDAAHYGRDWFGQVVVARDFGEALELRLQELSRLSRYRPARFIGLAEEDADCRRIRVANADGEGQIACRLLVAADGSHSSVRQALGIGHQQQDYPQTLFIARVQAEQAADGVAYERFTDHGPTALLPRGDRHFGVVHAVASDQADHVAGLDDAAWLQRIQQAFGWRVGRFLATGERNVYPASRILADQLIASRAVMLGNAAQTIHPIGAQGFNLGLRDALTLAEVIEGSSDPGAAEGLANYAQRRQQDRQRTLMFSDGLARISANPTAMMRPLRSLGLMAADASSSLQSLLVGGAMGFRGDVPALCREVAQ